MLYFYICKEYIILPGKLPSILSCRLLEIPQSEVAAEHWINL